MQLMHYAIKAVVWKWSGNAAWHFVSVPAAMSIKIKNLFGSMSGGFGSLPVLVTVGKTVWKTSIFWDGKSNTYMLPLKADVRKKEHIVENKSIVLTLELQI